MSAISDNISAMARHWSFIHFANTLGNVNSPTSDKQIANPMQTFKIKVNWANNLTRTLPYIVILNNWLH